MGVLVSSPAVALLLACLVTGARADQTLTALIASSCVTGLLLLLLILGVVIYFAIKYNRQQYDQANNNNSHKSPPTPLMANGYNPRGLPGTYNPLDPPSPATRAKSRTEHAVPPRQRPPLTFYTMRADPRDMGLAPPDRRRSHMPMSRSVPYAMAAPPTFGTPVLYLDMLDVAGGPRQAAALNGEVPRNATGEDGGLLIREVDNGDDPSSGEDRYRKREHKKSRSRSKSQGDSASNRERSRSQSRDAVSNHLKDSKRKSGRKKSPTDETPILAMPGDIIMTEAHHASSGVPPLEQLRRSYNYNSNHIDGPTTTTLEKRQYTMTFDDVERDTSEAQRRESAENYYLPSQSRGVVDDTFSTPFADYSQQSFPESADQALYDHRSSTRPVGLPEQAPDDAPTPWEAYNRPTTLSLGPGLQRLDSGSDHEPTPREDYSARPASTEIHSFSFPQVQQNYSSERAATSPTRQRRGSGGGGGAGDSNSFDAILNSVDLTDDGRGGGGGGEGGGERSRTVERAPTPPFDGEVSPRDVLYPSNHHSLRQRESTNDDAWIPSPPRLPSPPPDIPSPTEEGGDRDTGEMFSASTIPAAPRPPTPPPGRIMRPTDSQMEILRDLLEEGAKGKQQQQQQSRSSAAQQPSMPALPFMAELKRRQRDPEDEDDEETKSPAAQPRSSPPLRQSLGYQPPHEQKPMNAALQERGDDILRGLDAVLSPNALSTSRSQIVSFAEEPPRIIPGSSTSLLPDYDTDPDPPTMMAPPPPAPPPPPPPPPAPPAPTNFSQRF